MPAIVQKSLRPAYLTVIVHSMSKTESHWRIEAESPTIPRCRYGLHAPSAVTVGIIGRCAICRCRAFRSSSGSRHENGTVGCQTVIVRSSSLRSGICLTATGVR